MFKKRQKCTVCVDTVKSSHNWTKWENFHFNMYVTRLRSRPSQARYGTAQPTARHVTARPEIGHALANLIFFFISSRKELTPRIFIDQVLNCTFFFKFQKSKKNVLLIFLSVFKKKLRAEISKNCWKWCILYTCYTCYYIDKPSQFNLYLTRLFTIFEIPKLYIVIVYSTLFVLCFI